MGLDPGEKEAARDGREGGGRNFLRRKKLGMWGGGGASVTKGEGENLNFSRGGDKEEWNKRDKEVVCLKRI